MKKFNLRKNLVTAAFGAVVVLGGASQAYAAIAPSFTYDFDGVAGGSTIVANGITGTSAEILTVNGTFTGFNGLGWIQATAFNLGSALPGTSYSDTGLYAIFSISNTLLTGTLGAAGSVYGLDALTVTLKYDANRNNGFNAATGLVSNQGDDLVLGASTVRPGGKAFLFDFGSVALQAEGDFVLDPTNGSKFFIAPTPFYDLDFAAFISTGGSFAFNGTTLSIQNATGTIDFHNSIPEPASLALLGVALLGMGASRRRN